MHKIEGMVVFYCQPRYPEAFCPLVGIDLKSIRFKGPLNNRPLSYILRYGLHDYLITDEENFFFPARASATTSECE